MDSEEYVNTKKKKSLSQEKLTAKRDHIIKQNNILIDIKKGDDINTIEGIDKFIDTLKTEQII